MVFIVGLTGGIGSGKSTVASYFSGLHVPVIDADDVAYTLCQPGKKAFQKIHEHFGFKILDKNGNIDRKELRKIVFKEVKEKVWLEKVLHPLIIEMIFDWARNLDSSYCLVVAPLLFESSIKDYVDRIVVVDCLEKTQIERVCMRDHVSVEDVKLILNQQISRIERLKLTDDVIVNDSSLEALREKIFALHDFYSSLSNK